MASIASVARCFFVALFYGLPRTQQRCLNAMIDAPVHAVALRLYAGSTVASINITCHVAAVAFFSALMLASLGGRFGCYLGPRRGVVVGPPPGAPSLTAGAAGLRGWHRELKMNTLDEAARRGVDSRNRWARLQVGVTSTKIEESGMPQPADWKVPSSVQPKPQDYSYDLDRALAAVVAVHSIIPSDAFSAETLGTERAGNGVLIREDGVVLTIGYLITEAEQVWLTFSDGRVVPGHVLGYDQETGFGLVQALARLDLPALSLGQSSTATVGESVVVAGAGGRHHSVAAHIAARQEFAGYWEYVLDEAIFTAPAHPNWGGTAVIGPKGDLIGIGSLQLEQPREQGSEHLNMIVPIDLLKPILDDLLTLGRRNRPARPWLGLYATEVNHRVVVVGLSNRGPARKADLRTGDVVLEVGGAEVKDLAGLFRRIWSLGNAGVEVPMKIYRDGRTIELRVPSADRSRFLKGPRLH